MVHADFDSDIINGPANDSIKRSWELFIRIDDGWPYLFIIHRGSWYDMSTLSCINACNFKELICLVTAWSSLPLPFLLIYDQIAEECGLKLLATNNDYSTQSWRWLMFGHEPLIMTSDNRLTMDTIGCGTIVIEIRMTVILVATVIVW